MFGKVYGNITSITSLFIWEDEEKKCPLNNCPGLLNQDEQFYYKSVDVDWLKFIIHVY